jgi:hypothetical protein
VTVALRCCKLELLLKKYPLLHYLPAVVSGTTFLSILLMPQLSLDPELSGFIHNLRTALPYLEEFHQQTFVIQLSGDLLEIHNSRIIEDLVLLQQVGVESF